MLRERTAQRKLDFSAPGRDLVSILVSSVCSQALQGALSGVPGHPWRPSGRSRGAPGTLRHAPETLHRGGYSIVEPPLAITASKVPQTNPPLKKGPKKASKQN